MARLILAFFLLLLVSCKASNPSSEDLSRSFLEGYVSATQVQVATSLHSFFIDSDFSWQQISAPSLYLDEDASQHEVGQFCGQFNAFVLANKEDWELAYKNDVSVLYFDETHPAATVAGGLALCSLLQDLVIQNAIDELGIEEPKMSGPFAENYRLELGHGLWLLIKVKTSGWPRSEDGSNHTPPLDKLAISRVYLYQGEECITGILQWASLNKPSE